MEHTRCMRLDARFPLQFWVDAMDISIFLINREPSCFLDGGILKEAWTSKKM